MEIVEEVEFFTTVQCREEQERKCHTSYVTRYRTQEVERCKEEYEKQCEIVFQPEARNVSRTLCSSSLVQEDLEEQEEAEEECHDEVVVVTVETPVETCSVVSSPRQVPGVRVSLDF